MQIHYFSYIVLKKPAAFFFDFQGILSFKVTIFKIIFQNWAEKADMNIHMHIHSLTHFVFVLV